MSGGTFGYKQYHLETLIEEMDDLLKRLDREPEDSFECDSLQDKIKDEDFFKGLVSLNKALLEHSYVITQRLDWFLAGDDGEDSFKERFKEEIEKVEKVWYMI